MARKGDEISGSYKRRVAFLVGINNYWFGRWPRLEFAESDCYKLAEALCQPQYGFSREDMHILTGSAKEPSQQPIRSNFLYGNLFAEISSEPLDMLIFFFAGHGEEVDGQSYLVPADGIRGRIPETCVRLASIVEQISNFPARQKLMIFDICHGGGVRGDSPSLPPSFTSETKGVHGAVVLSACDVGELSYEDSMLKGGVFTHFWCEGLQGAVEPLPQSSISVFDVQKYAEGKVLEWAKRNSVNQNPQIWAANAPTIYLTPTYVPSESQQLLFYLTDRISRTETIVHNIQQLLKRPLPPDYCVRISATVSSFATSENEPRRDSNPQYHALLLKERDSLIQLLRKGASLKMILSWNLDMYFQYPDASLEGAPHRLTQLRNFCHEILKDKDLLSRIVIVKTPVRDRNLLFLGTDYFFEGRKLRVGSGFDATQQITDSEVIEREIEMFDVLFDDSVNYVCRMNDLPIWGRNRNQKLLEKLIEGLNIDLADPRLGKFDIERMAEDIYEHWPSTKTPRCNGTVSDLLPTIMYILGITYYGILLFAPHINKKWKISKRETEELDSETVNKIVQSNAIAEDKFQHDLKSLKEKAMKAMKGKTLNLDASANLKSIKENLSDNIDDIMNASGKVVDKGLIEYVVDYVVDYYRSR